MSFTPGSPYYATFFTENPITGAAQNADFLPTVSLLRNGQQDTSMTFLVTWIATGQYAVQGMIPNAFAAGDQLQISVTATVAGVAGKALVESITLAAPPSPLDLAPQVGQAALGPRSVASDAGTVVQQPLPDLATADRYLAAKAARAQKKRGVMFTKLIPAGAMPDSQGTRVGGIIFDQPGGIV